VAVQEQGGNPTASPTSLEAEPARAAGKVQAKAKGDLVLAPLPLAQSPTVVAQLRTAAGRCWGASFPSAKRNDTQQYVARSE
jgi:hypothetical protein